MAETSGTANEESLQNLSEKQTESHQQDSISETILNKEESTNEKVSEQHDVEMKNLKIPAAMKQSTLEQFLNQPTTAKRLRPAEDPVLSAPSKKKASESRMKTNKNDPFNFQSARKALFSECEIDKRVVVFSGIETTEQQPAQNQTSLASASTEYKNETSEQKSKPPPIHITSGSGVEIKRLTNEINNQPNSFLINTKKDKFKTKIVTTESWDDYGRFMKLLKDKHHHFHTYSVREPQLKYVLYGLPTMEIEELEKELQTENITPTRIVKMSMRQKRHENDDDQNYLLYFKKIQGENFLQTLNKVKRVYGFKVRWANYKTKHNGPTQCSKCLQFGHGQRGCNKPLNCFRCSEQHDSKTCPFVSKENNKVPIERLKCFFCGEKHTALSPDCNIRKQIIENWKAKSTNGNNRDQNKISGEHRQNTSSQRRFTPPTPREPERSKRSVPFTPRQQWRNNVPMPTTSKNQLPVHQNSKPVKPKPQNKNPLPNNRPSNQGKPNHNNNKNNKGNEKRKEQNKPVGNNKQNQNKNQVVEVMEEEVINPPRHTTNQTITEPSTSGNAKYQISTFQEIVQDTASQNENDSVTLTSGCLPFIMEMMKQMEKNDPKGLEEFLQTIGYAKITTNNHGC